LAGPRSDLAAPDWNDPDWGADYEEMENNNIKEERVVCDIGCAQGYFLKMLRDEFGFRGPNLSGTEYTVGFGNFARDEYGLSITEEIVEEERYDMISMYHVLEHFHDPRSALLKFKKLLKPGGVLYISVPVWLGILQEGAGATTNDFEFLLHLNHVSVFTAQSIRNLVATCGLKITQLNETIYGFTFLAEPTDEPEKIVREKPDELEAKLKLHKQAIELFRELKPMEAIGLVPDFPDAQIQSCMFKKQWMDENIQKTILNRALEALPEHHKILRQLALIELKWSEDKAPKHVSHKMNNGIRKMEELLWRAHAQKPGAEDHWHYLAIIEHLYKKNGKKAIEYWRIALRINPANFHMYNTYIGHVHAGLQLPAAQGAGRIPQDPTTGTTMTVQPKLEGLKIEVGSADLPQKGQ